MFNKDLQKGDYGIDVYNLQSALQKFGYGKFTPTGYFGDKTKQAVMSLQQNNNITPVYGYVGVKTRTFLNKILQSNRLILLYTAIGCLGTDASPNDLAPDEYACAETVSDILIKAFDPFVVNFTLSTYQLYNELLNSKEFVRVDKSEAGDIIISPTGYGNGNLPNGHVGIKFDDYNIMSNSSATGTFIKNYNLDTWKNRYSTLGGYPVVFFRKV